MGLKYLPYNPITLQITSSTILYFKKMTTNKKDTCYLCLNGKPFITEYQGNHLLDQGNELISR